MSKPTKVERTNRVNTVYELLVDGASRAEIIKYTNTEEIAWSVSSRTIDNYIHAATELFKAGDNEDREIQRSKAQRRLVKLYRKAHKVQDYKTALAVQQEINKLQGLYPAQDVNLNRDGNGIITGFTIEVISHKPGEQGESTKQIGASPGIEKID